MATIKFLLQSKSENASIYLRLSLGRNNTIKRKTGLYINSDNWSKATGLPKQNYAKGKNLTADLRGLKNYVIESLNNRNNKGETINGDWLQYVIDLHFKRINEDQQSELLTDAIQYIIDTANTRKNSKGGLGLSKSRINSYKSLKRILIEYQNKNQYKVKEVNIKFANDFLNYLLNTKAYQLSYATKKISDLKTVCFDAETNGISVHHQLKKIDNTKPKNDNVIYLNDKELRQIENTRLPTKSLENVRKWLLLGCNIGQRGGDLLSLNENNFVTRNGLELIELTQQKTGKHVTIPVLPTTKKILENGLPYKISIQRFNNDIKKVCELSGINEITTGSKIMMLDENGNEISKDKNGNYLSKGIKRTVKGEYPKHELISSHVCRRSFASNQYGTLTTNLIMQITAHSTEKMLLNYIGKQGLDYAQQIVDFYTLQSLKEKREPQLTVIKTKVQ